MRLLTLSRLVMGTAVLLTVVPASANLIINVNAGSGLSGNAAALAAFDRAASYWESHLSDPITVNINANFAALGSGILGSTSTSVGTRNYETVRTAMVNDEAGYSKSAVTNALPDSSQFASTVTLPLGFTYTSGNITATTANLKALGLLSATAPGPDASLTFSSDFTFDFDNSDGVAGTDFETVVLHEIGHALGFISVVDLVDQQASGDITINPLDLYRFRASALPLNLVQFTNIGRDLSAGLQAFFADSFVIYEMSTGVSKGDGRQASHWKDDNGILANYIGIMDPTLGSGQIEFASAADLYAFDLIGYDVVNVPESGTFALLLGGAALFHIRRRFAGVS